MKVAVVRGPHASRSPVSHRQFLALAVPLVLSAMSTPLLGAVDTAVVGRLPDPAYIGGVAVGSLIFNTLYWLLGFLRVSTSGFAAQVYGAGDAAELRMTFLRPLVLAVSFGILFVVAQQPILHVALLLIRPEADVAAHAAAYFAIRIWGAPFALAHYAILGWFMGVARVKTALVLQVFLNGLNIVLAAVLVFVFRMGVPGVAAASLMAEIAATVVGAALLLRAPQFRGASWRWDTVFASAPFLKMLKVNRDLFIRTACLLTAFGLFTAQGAAMGKTVLAANAILFQLHFLMAYILDGIANASGILVGKAVGGKDRALFGTAIKRTAQWGAAVSLALGAGVVAFGDAIIALFTDLAVVQRAAHEYRLWVALYPLAGFWGLQLNGVFVGATEAEPLRNSLIVALLVYIAALWLFLPLWQNHGLWLSFLLFSLTRSLALWAYLPRLSRMAFSM